jgi:NarL family two-component system sensor histidine kinase LiaS
MAAQLQNLLAARQQLATLEERNRLARDLHDSVKQQIFAISMQIAATRILLSRDVEAAGERLNKTEKLVQQAQQELTSLIRELRPVALEGKGLVAALRELLPQWSQQNEIVANLHVGEFQALPVTVEEALFRVVQEALSNIARHSQASLVQITLNVTDETISLSVQDNGQGFDLTHLEHRGVGLHSMQERMKALGGDLKLESAPGEGTQIVAHCARLGVDHSTEIGKENGESIWQIQSPL